MEAFGTIIEIQQYINITGNITISMFFIETQPNTPEVYSICIFNKYIQIAIL